ncbi:MAG: ABC transporter permease [Acidobacteriota bacterium]
MTSLNRKLIRDLWHLRGQVIAVALVVACGIATYITMRSAYDSLVISQASYYTDYRFADVFAGLKRAPESLAAEIARIDGVSSVQTRVIFEVTLDVPGLNEPASGRLISMPETHLPVLNDIYLRSGNYFQPGSRNEALISEGFAEANNLAVGSSIGAIINGRWERLRVIGIAISPEYVNEVRSGSVFPDKKRFGILWMNRQAIANALDMDGAFNDVSLTLAPGASEQFVIDRLDKLLERYGGFGAYGREEQTSHRFLSDEIKQDKVTGIFIPAIFLGVAAFLINIVLARLVSTQRDQIAVLKAFGYGNAQIGVHYLFFGLFAVLVGTAFGVALGAWMGKGLAELYTQFFHFPVLQFDFRWSTVVTAVLISAGAAFVGAISAVRRVVALPPAEAMRPEPPAQFHAGLLERLHLRTFFSTAARMIVRNIERRHWKAFLSIIGIAFAIAILIVGRYSLDALDYIINVHFRTLQREDVSVSFNNPRSSKTRYELTHLPGVLLAEPFRSVAARLRFEHRTKRIGILGIQADGDLRQPLDKDLRRVAVPPEGLLLSTMLADMLGVKAGDVVTVEVLEGQRPIKQVVVANLVDELIGISAYMDIRALNRLMNEGGTISGALMSVDALTEDKLYLQLKQTPAVGSVFMREAMLESFLQTIAENITISTTIIIAFACVIAFAVVYNSARIALSERGHELASLRVLGFTRREITVMLLGEQALLTLAAVPFGFALGYAICGLLVWAFNSETYRMPLVIGSKTYAFSFVIVCLAALFSGLLVRRRINSLDLVEVLKTRE